jgi:hypothetical protein
MKKIKILLYLLALAVVGLLGYQNQDFFMAQTSLRLDLYIREPYLSRPLPNAVLFLASFLAGLLLAYGYSLSGRFKSGRTIRQLNATVAGQAEQITHLRSDAEVLKGAPARATEEPPVS